MGGPVDAGHGGPEALPLAPREPGRGLPRWAPTALFAALVLLLGVVVAVQDPGADDPVQDDELALDLEGDTAVEADTAVAGPRDGLDSRRHPVVVTPAEGLADGQTVTVSGSGFPAHRNLGVVMCSPLGASAEGGAANCQLGGYTPVSSDGQGNFTVERVVHRYISLSNGVHDCAAPPPEGAVHTCSIAVGAIDDYDESGITGVHFDPDIPGVPPLSIHVDPAHPVEVGDLLTVTIENAEPGSSWRVDVCGSAEGDDVDEWGHAAYIALCASGVEGYGFCESADGCRPTGTEVVADADGRATWSVPAPATITDGDAVVDCRDPVSWCQVVARDAGAVSMSFPIVLQEALDAPPAPPDEPPPPVITDTTLAPADE